MPRMGPVAALLCLAIVITPSPAPAVDWVRVETPNLVVYGPGEKRTREITAEFERFREALSQILPTPPVSAVPTIVVAFENSAAFSPYRPMFNGKPVKLAGFYTGTETDDMIAFAQGDRESGLRVILHEYTHLITSNASHGLPLWVSEGLADFYSTFEIRPDGKQAILGRPVIEHAQLLNATSQWLTQDQLLNVTHDSPLYNEGERRSIFYAQSWAMVHLFMTGEPNRSKELGQYAQLTTGGMAPVEAWKRAFGDLDVQKELRRHLTRFTMRAFLYKFSEGVAIAKAEVKKPAVAEVEAVLARLRRYGKAETIEPQLTRAAEMTPPSMLARALLGYSHIRGDEDERGARLLMEAVQDTSDWLTQYYVASGIAALRAEPSGERLAAAFAAIDRVIAARPQLAHAHALKARLSVGAEGLASVRKARALAPGREDYLLFEARLLADMRDFAGARKTLAPLMGPNYPVAVRDRARSLMGQIVRFEEMSKRTGAAPPAVSKSPPTAAPPTPAPPISEPPADRPAVAPPTGTQWVLRPLKRSEQRTEGSLERIVCARGGAVTLFLRVGEKVIRYTAPQFSGIEFITYRQLQGGAITCGVRRPADHVYVTWRPLETPAAGIAGRPVAVEFLPDKE
jgi:hypothetical protein